MDTRWAAYVQFLEIVEPASANVISDYAEIFGLTTEESEVTRDHIEFWDVYRLCCGTQQSLSNRLRLHGCPLLRMWSNESKLRTI